jgi:diguanylate cyclase (GGDEF)-like protein
VTDGGYEAANHGYDPGVGFPAHPRILIVDDDPISLHLARSILCDEYSCAFATNGVDALALAATGPELILLDQTLPDLCGLEICQQIKSNPDTADIPIIFVTSSQDQSVEVAALAAGAVDFVIKPYSSAVLKARVHTHVTLHRRTAIINALANQDGLTGVANRRCFDRALEKEWRIAQRQQAPLSVIMVDIDHFKQVNDTYGHQTGDACLRAVARCIAETLRRPSDLVARYGGEEFVVLLPQTHADGARQLAEIIRQRIEKHASSYQDDSEALPHFTASLGCATLVPDEAQPAAQRLVTIADENLYRAKRGGRNRVVATDASADPNATQHTQRSFG